MDRRLCRAARGIVGWSRKALAREAHVSVSTVRGFETGEWVHGNRIAAMRAALERAGVEFLPQPDGRMSVRPRDTGRASSEITLR